MFAAFVLERPLAEWSQFSSLFFSWVQSVGGVAAIGLLIYCLAKIIKPEHASSNVMRLRLIARAVAFSVVVVAYLPTLLSRWFAVPPALFTIAGGIAIVLVLIPIIRAIFTSISFRRIWAITRLSLTECVRRRVALVFAIMALVFLFADWFVPYKQEDQVRNYVRVVYWSMTPLFLLTASLLGAFSIPNDVKSQAIHTIVTKPVERIEIVLGRFLGFGIVITLGLVLVAGLSWVYILRGVTPEARQESFKARVPVFGFVQFAGGEGTSVGREWDYRKYISGPPRGNPNQATQYAVWTFVNLPAGLGSSGEPIPFELTFDIFRLTKGEENKGVFCNFTFADPRLTIPEMERSLEDLGRERSKRLEALYQQEKAKRQKGESSADIAAWMSERKAAIEDELLTEFPVYRQAGIEVTDYHTRSVTAPAALFKKLEKLFADAPAQPDGSKIPLGMRVYVNVDPSTPENAAQYVGVASRDFYLLAAELPFWQNFLKGFLGMWFTFILVLGVAIAISTYLSGVISWLATIFLYGAGMCTDYIREIAENRMIGGGPIESLTRIATKTAETVPSGDSPGAAFVTFSDNIYRFILGLVLNILPDVNRFDLHHYVANGFDIPWSQVLLLDNFIYLVGYLVPWMVLAYFLMKYREIANPT